MRLGEMIKAATQQQLTEPVHPTNPDIRGVTIGQLSAPPSVPGAHRKNTVIVSPVRFACRRTRRTRSRGSLTVKTTFAIGTSGARNAALFAVRMLATRDPDLRERLRRFIDGQRDQVLDQGLEG